MQALVKSVKLNPPQTNGKGEQTRGPSVSLGFQVGLSKEAGEMLAALGNSEWADIEVRPTASPPAI